jgi:alkylhydroperoxidase family enzyme
VWPHGAPAYTRSCTREQFSQLEATLLSGDGKSSSEDRQQASDYARALASDPGSPNPREDALATWTEKVARHAYKTIDEEVDALKAESLSEDEIFELTLATAYGAAKGRFDRAIDAIEKGYEE